MRILLAEDEKDLSRALTAILEHSKYAVDAVYDGQAAVECAAENAYDAMILDIMMPKLDGVSALKQIRAAGNYTPALFLTAKAEIDDRIAGLDAGADDYLTKPFAMGELLARIRSMTRRAGTYTVKKLKIGSVALDTAEQELSCENSIRLASKETKLMEYFMTNFGKALSTDEIFSHVWADDPQADHKIVFMYISFLRSKIRAVNGDIEISGNEGETYTLRSVADGDVN
ncbi:MAG: response regulator transcription factor [Ruminococcus sp.]|nr:response regulator transcription factor [Ruminococcus sp.]HAE53313.1 DNA-binding response regulator [Ruminococcus sp.]